jgi:hypothetical protein
LAESLVASAVLLAASPAVATVTATITAGSKGSEKRAAS